MAGLFSSIAAGFERKEARTLDSLPGFMFGPESKAGVSVTWSTALHVSAMLACCKVVGEGIAQTRCKIMRPRAGGIGADPARDHPLFRLLHLSPMKGQTAFNFWETLVFHVMLVGNAYAYINRTGGRVFELIQLDPSKVRVTRRTDLTLVYEVTSENGEMRRIAAEDIWHVRGPSWNSWMGMETVRLAREALGLAISLEANHAGQHKNGASPSGVYSVEGPLTPEQHSMLTDWLKKQAANPGMPMILDRGAKWFSQQMSGVDSQHLETRRFQIEDICRAVRVMPIMVGQSDKAATYASAEQMFLAHVIHCLAPWATRLEESIEVDLLTEAEQAQGLYAKFNLSALMRGDYKSRQEGLNIQRRAGVISADEWRALEDMNPRDDEGGGQYIVESNMAVQDGRDLVPMPSPPSPQGSN